MNILWVCIQFPPQLFPLTCVTGNWFILWPRCITLSPSVSTTKDKWHTVPSSYYQPLWFSKDHCFQFIWCGIKESLTSSLLPQGCRVNLVNSFVRVFTIIVKYLLCNFLVCFISIAASLCSEHSFLILIYVTLSWLLWVDVLVCRFVCGLLL